MRAVKNGYIRVEKFGATRRIFVQLLLELADEIVARPISTNGKILGPKIQSNILFSRKFFVSQNDR